MLSNYGCWRRLQSPLHSPQIEPVNPKGNQPSIYIERGLQRRLSCKESAAQCRSCRRPAGVLSLSGGGNSTHSSTLAAEFHGQRNLLGYSPLGHRELDMNEHLPLHTLERLILKLKLQYIGHLMRRTDSV